MAKRYASLYHYGSEYKNACAPATKKLLRDQLYMQRPPDAKRLWKAIDVLLCAPKTDANARYIAGILANKIHDTAWGTGQDTVESVVEPSMELAGSLLASNAAWDASLRIEHHSVKMMYHSNEVCVADRTLRFMKGKWRISDIGEACD